MGPLHCPVANPTWAPYGLPILDPYGNPDGALIGPIYNVCWDGINPQPSKPLLTHSRKQSHKPNKHNNQQQNIFGLMSCKFGLRITALYYNTLANNP